jgi:sugar/nucleoside kinase (ribokinase family)
MSSSVDISLYGHLTHDIVFDGFKQTHSLGAIANLWDVIVNINPSISINIQPTMIGKALILVDKESKIRVSKPNMNLIENNQINTLIKTKWSHIVYINQLTNLEFIKDVRNISDVISADISTGGKIPNEYLKYIDYLFISDEDIDRPLEDLVKLVNGWVILHYPNGSISTNGKNTIKCETQIINNLNVLGAGDTFASCFITEMLKGNNIENSLNLAHSLTYKILKQKNEKV